MDFHDLLRITLSYFPTLAERVLKNSVGALNREDAFRTTKSSFWQNNFPWDLSWKNKTLPLISFDKVAEEINNFFIHFLS